MSDTPDDAPKQTEPIEAVASQSPGTPERDLPAAPPPMPGAPAIAPAYTSNGLAVGALVVGIVSLVLFFIPGFGALLGIVAIVLGALGIARANRIGGKQRGVAIAGLVCGAVGLVVNVLFVVLIVNVASDPTVQDIFSSMLPTATPS
jgi:hypothetical protein